MKLDGHNSDRCYSYTQHFNKIAYDRMAAKTDIPDWVSLIAFVAYFLMGYIVGYYAS